MVGAIIVKRSHWLGFRWEKHGLGGAAGQDELDDLLLLGVQDSRQGTAEQSLIQRTRSIGSTTVAEAISPGGPLVSLWSVRGAPHAHRLTHLNFVRDALRPQVTDDGGAEFIGAVDDVAAALSTVVSGPTSKSDASTWVTEHVSPAVVEWCERCKADHVPEALFRAAGRQAQIVLGPEERRVTILHPTPDHPQKMIDHPRLKVLNAYFRVNGPTTRTQFRDWSASGSDATADLWNEVDDDLVRVQVDDRRYDLPASLMDEVGRSPEPHGVVLVPPNDPYLRQVDRTLLVPNSKRRYEVWRPLSGPGALLVDGEVAGTWRYRRGDRTLAIVPFERLAPAQRNHAEESARLVAEAVNGEAPHVTWD